jgi:O-antigen ligase
MMNAAIFKHYLHSGALFFFVLACFFTPFSTSLMGAASVIAFVCWIFSGQIGTAPKLVRNNAPLALAVLLFFLLAAGVFYSPATLADGLAVLKKYRELLFLVMAFALACTSKKTARYALFAFIIGSILLLTLSYAMYFHLIPMEKYGNSNVYHITHSFFMAFLAFWALQFLLGQSQYRFLWLPVLIATLFNLFYIAPGRTGMLVFLVLLILTLYQRLRVWVFMVAVMITLACIYGAYKTSHNFSSRVDAAVEEIQKYKATSSRTSLGQRFDWWHNSVQLIQERPLFGHGTGSFAIEQQRIIKGTATKPTDNPHSEYLFIGVQSGIVGLMLYVFLLLMLFYDAGKLSSPASFLLQGVVIAMACGCLMNSFLFDSHQGHFFAFLAGILLADPFSNKNPADQSPET